MAGQDRTDGPRVDLDAYRRFAEPGVDFDEPSAGVLRMILDDEEHLNAVPQRVHDRLPELYATVAADRRVDAMVLEGRGRYFSSGGRVDQGMGERSAADLVELHRVATRIITSLLEVPQPTLCVVNGPAIGWAASLALHHDLIVAADTAYFADPHVSFGAAAGDGGTSIWPLVLGPAKAKEYLLTGARLPADEAERRGLVNRVVAPDRLGEEAMGLLDAVLAQAPLAVRMTKMAINTRLRSRAEWDMSLGLAAEMVTLTSRDFRRAVDGFTETGSFDQRWSGD